jgi:hypothetical protein
VRHFGVVRVAWGDVNRLLGYVDGDFLGKLEEAGVAGVGAGAGKAGKIQTYMRTRLKYSLTVLAIFTHSKYRVFTLWVKRGFPGMIPLEHAGLEVR